MMKPSYWPQYNSFTKLHQCILYIPNGVKWYIRFVSHSSVYLPWLVNFDHGNNQNDTVYLGKRNTPFHCTATVAA